MTGSLPARNRSGLSNGRELLMDIQRAGADDEVIAPAELREQMRKMLAAALGRYAAGLGARASLWERIYSAMLFPD